MLRIGVSGNCKDQGGRPQIVGREGDEKEGFSELHKTGVWKWNLKLANTYCTQFQ